MSDGTCVAKWVVGTLLAFGTLLASIPQVRYAVELVYRVVVSDSEAGEVTRIVFGVTIVCAVAVFIVAYAAAFMYERVLPEIRRRLGRFSNTVHAEQLSDDKDKKE